MLCSTSICFVHYIVVHKRGDVDEFHDHGKIDMSGVDLAGRTTSQKRQQRPQTFASTTHCVHDVALDCRIEGRRLLRNACLDFFEMRLNQLRHFSQRAGRRGCRSPTQAWA
jgi:hypothetical protein